MQPLREPGQQQQQQQQLYQQQQAGGGAGQRLRWVRRGLTSGLYQLQQQVGWLGHTATCKHVSPAC
jgi:hypothetical protein